MSLADMDRGNHTTKIIVDIIFCLPRFASWTMKIPKILAICHKAAETSRLTWRNPFEHWSTQNAILGQINQNDPGQTWVNQKSKSVKIISKQHFSCFYIKLELLGDFHQL